MDSLNYNVQSLHRNLGESLPRNLQQKFDSAISQIQLSKGAVVALSAGVDSSLVALIAHKALGDHAVALTGVSESLTPNVLEITKESAKAIGIKYLLIRIDLIKQI